MSVHQVSAAGLRFLTATSDAHALGHDCVFPGVENTEATADRLVASGHLRRQWGIVCESDGQRRVPEEDLEGYALTALGTAVVTIVRDVVVPETESTS